MTPSAPFADKVWSRPVAGQPQPPPATLAAGPRAPLNLQRIARNVFWISLLLLLNRAGNWGAGVFFAILFVMALRGPVPALMALAICYLGISTNNFFVPKSVVWTPGRLILPALCFIRLLPDLAGVTGGLRVSVPYVTFIGFVTTMAVGSILSGWYTQIALLKLLNFFVCLSAIAAATRSMRLRKFDATEWFVSLIATSTLFGVASIPLGQSRNFSQMRSGEWAASAVSFTSFNGAFGHPNSHSLFGPLFLMFALCIAIFSGYRRRNLAVLLVITWLSFILYSQSRTAVAAVIVPSLAVFVLATPHIQRAGAVIVPRVKRSTLLLAAVALAFGVGLFDLTSGGVASKAAVKFIHKWDAEESEELNLEKAMASRQGLIDLSWSNFRESPIYGIGFGVAKTEAFISMATLFTAPAEKGFLPTAILEEGGVMGTSAFVLWILTLLGTWFREKNIPVIIVFLAFLTSNFGEVSIFSPGGAGGFGWVMIGAAAILGDNCWQRRAPRGSAANVPGQRGGGDGRLPAAA